MRRTYGNTILVDLWMFRLQSAKTKVENNETYKQSSLVIALFWPFPNPHLLTVGTVSVSTPLNLILNLNLNHLQLLNAGEGASFSPNRASREIPPEPVIEMDERYTTSAQVKVLHEFGVDGNSGMVARRHVNCNRFCFFHYSVLQSSWWHVFDWNRSKRWPFQKWEL